MLMDFEFDFTVRPLRIRLMQLLSGRFQTFVLVKLPMSSTPSPRKPALAYAYDNAPSSSVNQSSSRQSSARGNPSPRSASSNSSTAPSGDAQPRSTGAPAFSVSLYDLAVPKSSAPSNPSDTPFVEVLSSHVFWLLHLHLQFF
jgi:hypothetical protein